MNKKIYKSFFLFLFVNTACFCQVTCCCGTPREMDFPGFDFEFGPDPPPGGFNNYTVGSAMGPWSITAGSVDHVDKDHYMMTSYGNPNGPSNYIDLYGSPPGGGLGPGTMEYPLSGLTVGYIYTIQFYYATFGLPGKYQATVKVANGAWLNETWDATNAGNVIWLKASYKFIAKASTANLDFTDSGGTPSYGQIGMLIDDIKIFECPNDDEKPMVNNPPKDIVVDCDKNVPAILKLNISDNCDLNPLVTFKETKDANDPCAKKITREWTIKDACGNVTNQKQVIDIIDKSAPQFTKSVQIKTAYCTNDVVKEFNDWIKNNGNAIAKDDCGGPINWQINYDRLPKNYCDTILTEFIVTDQCGNMNSAYSSFIVQDSTYPKFIVKAISKDFKINPYIRDSLRAWLSSNGFSKSTSGCDSANTYSNFNGDSTKNPIDLTFYVKNRCGNIDSCTASFSYQKNSSSCCCGVQTELSFPNLDFEAPPMAPPGGWIDYSAGQNYAGWQIDFGSVSIHSPTHLNLGFGNPNGASQHMDLHGSTQGSATYTLYGLTAGNLYTIMFWYAIHSFGSNVSAKLMVNGGSLLNASWSATNTGDVLWLPASYNFIANATTANMTFVGTGATPCCGMLIDDIHIFECPNDIEKPMVNNPPVDLVVECESDVPAPAKLNVSDNCDLNPSVTLKETKQTIDACTKKITRDWEVKDACGNITTLEQVIDIIDKNPPVFSKRPVDKLVYCNQDVNKEFTDWLKKNGNAIAADQCGAITWRVNPDHAPKKYCDTVLTEFFATDHCGNESSDYANFIVRDTSAPKFTIPAQSKNLLCVPNSRDSLRTWLLNYGFSQSTGFCDTLILGSNFNGDSTQNPLKVTFYAKDRCGNIDSCLATFTSRSASDTFRLTNFSCSFPKNSIDTFLFKPNGCDSIVIVRNIKNKSDSVFIQQNTCDAKHKPFDTIRLINQTTCDSIIFYEFILKPTPVTNLQIMDCAILVYSKDSIKLSGQYCDSLVITEHIPLQKDSVTIHNTTCDKTKQDTVILSFKNSLGCDSIVSIQTIYNGQQTTFLTKQECGLSKNFTDTAIYKNGICDSFVITSHIALPNDTFRIQSTSCDITKTGIFSKLLINQFGCDSLVIETVHLLQSDSSFVSNTSCVLSQAGIHTIRLKNKFNCDSVVTTTTAFIPSDTVHIHSFTCDISKQRNDTAIIQTKFCDSLVITTIVFIPSVTFHIQTTTCDINLQKTDTLVIPTKFCDSIVIRNIQFIPSDTMQILQISCIPALAGKDTIRLQNANGCDSLIYKNVQFIPKHLQFQLDSISCLNKDDGKISILNASIFSNPIEILLNNNLIANQTIADNLAAGNYSFSVKDKDGCISDTIDFQLNNPSAFTTELGSDLLLNPGQVIKLNLSSNTVPTFIYWTPQGISSCTQCPEIEYKANQEGWIFTLAIDDRGCESRDSIFIRLKKASRIFAPNAISINGDNINDHFYLIGDNNIVIELLEIYDRWGERLYSIKNITPNHPESGWNGMFNNEKTNPGVYVYFAKVKYPSGELEVLKGDFTLIR